MGLESAFEFVAGALWESAIAASWGDLIRLRLSWPGAHEVELDTDPLNWLCVRWLVLAVVLYVTVVVTHCLFYCLCRLSWGTFTLSLVGGGLGGSPGFSSVDVAQIVLGRRVQAADAIDLVEIFMIGVG